MRHLASRTTFLGGVAIVGALIWGLAETLALQWARINEGASWRRKFLA